MLIFILTIILMYAIDTFLVGISFYSLKNRFRWQISTRMSLLILFLIFAFLESYILPMVLILDITYTVGNTGVAEVFNLKPNEPLIDLFGFGLFEIIIWVFQSLLAAFVGEKIVKKESTKSV